MPRLSIRTKLALLLSSLSLTLVAVLLVAVKVNFDQGFASYLNAVVTHRAQTLATRLASEAGSREALARLVKQRSHWRRMLRESFIDPDAKSHRDARDSRGHPDARDHRDLRDHRNHRDPPRHVPPPGGLPSVWVLDTQQRPLSYPPLPADIDNVQKLPIRTESEVIGYLAVRAPHVLDNAVDAMFAQHQHRWFAITALVAVILSIVLAWPLSRYLVTPVQRLSRAMRALMAHDYNQRVPVTSRDELGELAHAFNRMAETLGEHDIHQRQWLADISHELRTPLAVLKGELEALQDGVLPLEPVAITSLSDEVLQLTRLVDDLHQLAVTQVAHLRYRFEPVDLVALIEQLHPRLTALLQGARLSFDWQRPTSAAMINADRQRLEQLIMNLAQNSARYTDPDGCIKLRIDTRAGIVLRWEDSAPGVASDDLSHLFDRFYRVEKSRQRAVGGSGLGLSIVANIVAAHGASLQAMHSSLGGLMIVIDFSRQANTP